MAAVVVGRIENWAKEKGATPMGVMSKVSRMQERKKAPAISESAIRRVLRGESFQRGRVERRGAPKKVTKKVIKACEKSRVKLLKKAKSQRRVTYLWLQKQRSSISEAAWRLPPMRVVRG